MKNLKFLKNIFLLFIGFFCLQACDENEVVYPQLTIEPLSISEIVEEDSNLSVLYGAMKEVGLDSLLNHTTTYTFFAPNDQAFSSTTLENLSEEEIENMLLNHTLSTVTADFISKLETGYYHSLATGPLDLNLSLFVNNVDNTSMNGLAKLVSGAYDKGATNGVLHTIDAVLVPPTVIDHVFANPEYALFHEALVLTEFENYLEDDGLYTTFAPDNQAFEALLIELNGAFGWESLEDIPIEVLKEIVLYHTVADLNLLSAEFDGSELQTMQGEFITIEGTSIKDASYSLAEINLMDIQGINGIMHGIDKVLLTEDVFQSILGATLNMVERCEDREFTEFLKAIDKAGLTESLATEELTAFVPNNDAFTLFFIGIDNYSSLDDFTSEDDIALLKSLMEYHLYSGLLAETDLTDGKNVETIYGDNITVEKKNSTTKLVPSLTDGAKGEVVNGGIGASNGIIHEINRVLIPTDLAQALGVAGSGGFLPVDEDAYVYFNFNGEGYDSWWGDVPNNPKNDAASSADGTPFFDATDVQGSGWTGLFFRNSGNNFTPTAIGTDIDNYEFMFDINVKAPTTGVIKFRFQGSIGDVFYDWDISQIDEAGWVTVVLPANILGVSDFSLVDGEFGAAYSGDSMLNFSIDNVRFEEVKSKLEPVADDAYEYFNFNGEGYDSWWGDVPDNPKNDAAASADGTPFFGASGVQGSGWTGLFWRNAGDNFDPAAIGTDIDNYVLKFDINVIENFADGVIKFRFQGSIGDVFYDWDATQIEGGKGWQTVTIPASTLGVSDFSLVDGEFGAAYSGSSMLNFSMDNMRFEPK